MVPVVQLARQPALHLRQRASLSSFAQVPKRGFVLLGGLRMCVPPSSVIARLDAVRRGAVHVATLVKMPCQLSGRCHLVRTKSLDHLAHTQVQPPPTMGG